MVVTIRFKTQGEKEYVIADEMEKINLRNELEANPMVHADFDHAIVRYDSHTVSTVDKGDIAVEGTVKDCYSLNDLITELKMTGV